MVRFGLGTGLWVGASVAVAGVRALAWLATRVVIDLRAALYSASEISPRRAKPRSSCSSEPALAAAEQGLAQFRDRPALIVWGGRDFCFNDFFLARWREILPGAEVNRIADAGHYVLEDARDEAVPRIARFLTQP